jgi:hypothetical protein
VALLKTGLHYGVPTPKVPYMKDRMIGCNIL